MQLTNPDQWLGRTALDSAGEKIGTIDDLYVDPEAELPEWALVNTGLFGTKSSFVPLAGAALEGNDVRLGVDKAQIQDAPRLDPDGLLSQEEEAKLFRHYGVPYDESGTVTAQGTPGGGGGQGGAGVGGQYLQHQSGELGESRLRRYELTDNQTTTPPGQRGDDPSPNEPSADGPADAAEAPGSSEVGAQSQDRM